MWGKIQTAVQIICIILATVSILMDNLVDAAIWLEFVILLRLFTVEDCIKMSSVQIIVPEDHKEDV